MNVVVYLAGSVDAFRMSPQQLNDLRACFPAWSFAQARTQAEAETLLPQADLFVTWQFKPDWYRLAPKLRGVFTPAAGSEGVAYDPGRKIPVFHGAFHGAIMAESLVAMILHFNRRIGEIERFQRLRQWERDFLCGTHRLGVQHVVIIGYGSIGGACARVLRPFGCRITGVKRSARDPWRDRDAHAIVAPSDLTAALREADHVACVLPGGQSTDRLITREHIAAMKPAAYLYNIGRGNCYAENDLVWALEQGRIAGAGLDVYEQEPLPRVSRLWGLPNVLIMPHASAICAEYLELYVEELKERLRAFA